MSLLFNVLPEERESRAAEQPTFEVLKRILPVLTGTQFAVLLSMIAGIAILAQVFVQLQLSQGSFVEGSLRQDIRMSTERMHVLQGQLMKLTSTKSLAAAGHRFNMSEVTNPVGISMSDGEVHGRPQAAPGVAQSASQGVGVDTSSGAWSTDDSAVLVSKG